MNETTEEIYAKDKTRNERRRKNVIHAKRKRAKAPDWYDNLHEYSKGKIHCSCPICRIRTSDRKSIISEPPVRDKRKLEALEQELNCT